eukprot:gene318-6732_t
MVKVLLTAFKEKGLLDAWTKYAEPVVELAKQKGIELVVVDGSILDLTVDSIVSPANSFGFMRGGIDGIYTKKFGLQVENDVQSLIKEEHDGEMLVGQAEVVETGDKNIPYCISAPTMRIGTTLEETTTNPFLAARAVFLLWKKGSFKYGKNKGKAVKDIIDEIAFPGLGTGVGGVSYEACAFQVVKAIREVLMDEFTFPKNHQPKDLHHELWQIDKPISCARMQISDFNSYLNYKNPKASIIMYHDDAILFYKNEKYEGKKSIFGFYDKLYKSGLKGFKLDITNVKNIENDELLIKLDYISNTIQGKMDLKLNKFQPEAEWLITHHKFE